MRRRHLLALALLALVATVMSSNGPARATDWIDRLVWLNGPRYDSDLPACEAALYEVTNRFAEKERKFWNSTLEIVDFANVREFAKSPSIGLHASHPVRVNSFPSPQYCVLRN